MNICACPRSSSDWSLKNLAMPATAMTQAKYQYQRHGDGQGCDKSDSIRMFTLVEHNSTGAASARAGSAVERWGARAQETPGRPTLSREKNA